LKSGYFDYFENIAVFPTFQLASAISTLQTSLHVIRKVHNLKVLKQAIQDGAKHWFRLQVWS